MRTHTQITIKVFRKGSKEAAMSNKIRLEQGWQSYKLTESTQVR